LVLRESLRWVPPTTALLQRRKTKEALLLGCPPVGLVDERTLGWPIQKGQPYIPGQNAEALPPKSGNYLSRHFCGNRGADIPAIRQGGHRPGRSSGHAGDRGRYGAFAPGYAGRARNVEANRREYRLTLECEIGHSCGVHGLRGSNRDLFGVFLALVRRAKRRHEILRRAGGLRMTNLRPSQKTY